MINNFIDHGCTEAVWSDAFLLKICCTLDHLASMDQVIILIGDIVQCYHVFLINFCFVWVATAFGWGQLQSCIASCYVNALSAAWGCSLWLCCANGCYFCKIWFHAGVLSPTIKIWYLWPPSNFRDDCISN